MTPSPAPTPRTLLEVLRDRVRSLEATQQDTDALPRAMDRPLGPKEDVPRRARVLHFTWGRERGLSGLGARQERMGETGGDEPAPVRGCSRPA